MRCRVAAGLLLLLAGCSNRPGYTLTQRPDDALRVAEPGYYEVLDRYTRYLSGYDGFDQRFFFAATWQSWAFRRCRTEATAEFLSWEPEELAAALATEREEASRYVDFYVGLYTADPRWNDLSSRDSIWRIELELSDGSVLLPEKVKRIHRPSANEQALYAYLTPFWIGYRIRFAGADEAGRPLLRQGEGLGLRISSAVGRALATWVVEAGDLPGAPGEALGCTPVRR